MVKGNPFVCIINLIRSTKILLHLHQADNKEYNGDVSKDIIAH